jgi:hypothetical protein
MTNKSSSLNHTAILVTSVKKAIEALKPYEFKIGEVEDFEGEGTREVYIEYGKKNSLLILEPIKEGAYQSALKKRGPGLHHIAIDVVDLNAFLETISGSGWLLHPVSLKTITKTKTAWLARPGFPSLIEVQERKKIVESELFVQKLGLKVEATHKKLLQAISLHEIVKKSLKDELILAGTKIAMSSLWGKTK